jgi:acyl carrier protein
VTFGALGTPMRIEANMIDAIRQALDEHGRLTAAAAALHAGSDLYAAGLTSFAAVQLMLALEEKFDVEFPDKMLNRKSFASIGAIMGCLMELDRQGAAA